MSFKNIKKNLRIDYQSDIIKQIVLCCQQGQNTKQGRKENLTSNNEKISKSCGRNSPLAGSNTDHTQQTNNITNYNPKKPNSFSKF
jgi:hypothetical protein